MEFPELILECALTWYLSVHLLQHFEFSKVVENIYSYKHILGCDVIFNVKAPKDVIIKGVCRGGRFDDLLRGMLLFHEVNEKTLKHIEEVFENILPHLNYDYWWEDDQAKESWPCIKFYLYSTNARLNGQVAPIELQIHTVGTFVYLKQSNSHEKYEIERLKSIDKH